MAISSNLIKIIHNLADGRFHSGTELAEIVGISRSAVCKYVKQLADLGLELSAVSGRGYCLLEPIQLLQETKLKKHLTEQTSGLIKTLEIHPYIHSTNQYLSEKANDSAMSGSVCFAEYQTAGKGRRGRDWVSPFGSNIYLSILSHFQSGPAAISGLSLAVGVAVVRALNECGIEEVGLKWPNDIYWQGKKLAGILIEVSGESGGPCHAVVGLGLNFYMPEKYAQAITQDWVDLNQILDRKSSKIRNKLAAVLLNHVMPTINAFEKDTLQPYLEHWRSFDCMKGKAVCIYLGNQLHKGIVVGIDDNGMLLLLNDQGEIKTFASGEVSFRQA